MQNINRLPHPIKDLYFYFDNSHSSPIKGGQAKFIEMWRCWTPNQLPLLKGNLTKVLFLSAPSTGKTALMEAKAFQCKQNGFKVLFLVPYANASKEIETLLKMKMQGIMSRWCNNLDGQQQLQGQNIEESTHQNSFEMLAPQRPETATATSPLACGNFRF